MNKLIIVHKNKGGAYNAGGKAPDDVVNILVNNSYEPLYFKSFDNIVLNILVHLHTIAKIFLKVCKRDEIVFQFPSARGTWSIWDRTLLHLLKLKRCYTIAIVHDIYSLRLDKTISKKDIQYLNLFNKLIIHSDKMKEELNNAGCKSEMVTLGLFDYLVESENKENRTLSYSITIAGNLAKSEYLPNIVSLVDKGLSFNLYGIKCDNIPDYPNIFYKGIFKPEDVSHLEGSWGLVWDGPSIKECTGEMGEYLRFNSPHKSSLYVMANLPLIVPKTSAIANYVVNENIGIAINSIEDVPNIIKNFSETQYRILIENLNKVSKILGHGGNLLSAINKSQQ